MTMTDFEVFARAQLPGLLRYSVMLTGDRELAADLVQDVLVKMYRQWSRISRADRPDRYAVRMVTNQFLSWRRSRAARHIAVAELPNDPHTEHFETTHAVRDDMWRRLAKLPKRQRAVLVLRYYQQLTDAEIADVLGCTRVTVRGYAHRALATLRVDLNAELIAGGKEIR
jgi:RNA polymerase sigma-70 factor (sigma-E family)